MNDALLLLTGDLGTAVLVLAGTLALSFLSIVLGAIEVVRRLSGGQP